jgi:hypothetical protein
MPARVRSPRSRPPWRVRPAGSALARLGLGPGPVVGGRVGALAQNCGRSMIRPRSSWTWRSPCSWVATVWPISGYYAPSRDSSGSWPWDPAVLRTVDRLAKDASVASTPINTPRQRARARVCELASEKPRTPGSTPRLRWRLTSTPLPSRRIRPTIRGTYLLICGTCPRADGHQGCG